MVYIHRHSSILRLDLFDVGMVSVKAAHHTEYQHMYVLLQLRYLLLITYQ